MFDTLGKRMKEFYEDITRYKISRRTNTIIRIDGKAFHTYVKGLQKPFDDQLIKDMDSTACFLCENIQGAKFAYVQSDEISILVTDYDKLNTSAWFDGNIQKIASISASLATAKFNQLRPNKIALFDSRAFSIARTVEVENYFIWRQQDATRNSISALAQSLFSTNELKRKKTNDMQEMCFQKGINWNDLPANQKRGRLIVKQQYDKNGSIRNKWVSIDAPIFTKERDFFKTLAPIMYE